MTQPAHLNQPRNGGRFAKGPGELGKTYVRRRFRGLGNRLKLLIDKIVEEGRKYDIEVSVVAQGVYFWEEGEVELISYAVPDTLPTLLIAPQVTTICMHA